MAKSLSILILGTIVFSIAACSKTKTVISGTVAGVTVALSNSEGVLRHGSNNFWVTFKDSSGNPVDVGAVSIDFYLPATTTSRAINNPANVAKTDTIGTYQAKTKIDVAGPWNFNVAFEGPAGTGKGSFPIPVQ